MTPGSPRSPCPSPPHRWPGLALRLLVQVCADAGRYGEAQSWARRLRHRVEAMTPHPGQALVFAAGTLSSLHLRFGFWLAAADLRVDLEPEARVAERGLLTGMELYARGLRALETGKLVEAERACDELDALHPPLSEERKADQPHALPARRRPGGGAGGVRAAGRTGGTPGGVRPRRGLAHQGHAAGAPAARARPRRLLAPGP